MTSNAVDKLLEQLADGVPVSLSSDGPAMDVDVDGQPRPLPIGQGTRWTAGNCPPPPYGAQS